MTDMTTETAITSQQLVTAKAKDTMQNPETDPDQEHNCNQGPIFVILETQDTNMVTKFMMMTTEERNRDTHLLLSLVQGRTMERFLLEPNLLLFNIKT